jgi:hypothetical protein
MKATPKTRGNGLGFPSDQYMNAAYDQMNWIAAGQLLRRAKDGGDPDGSARREARRLLGDIGSDYAAIVRERNREAQ